ncbi:hypothetical protein PG994_002550 [Apiospora phragmitis]|uniref:Uncharacterized protein n=1 Tax=Apiospora phragmitis TaxID=2905665 RepID=A0ABR1W5L3_9PEZI
MAGFFANIHPAGMVSAASRFLSGAASAMARGLFGRSGADQQQGGGGGAAVATSPAPRTPRTLSGRGRPRKSSVKQESVTPSGAQEEQTTVKREHSQNLTPTRPDGYTFRERKRRH